MNENFRIEDQIIYILISWDVVCGEINWTFFPLYLSFIYQKKRMAKMKGRNLWSLRLLQFVVCAVKVILRKRKEKGPQNLA